MISFIAVEEQGWGSARGKGRAFESLAPRSALTDQSGNDTVITFDANGNPTISSWMTSPVTGVNFFVADDSWVATTPGATYGEYSAAPIELSTSSWPGSDGVGAGGASPDLTVTNFLQTAPNQTTIANVMGEIITALPNNAQCNNWLQAGGQSQGSGLQQMQLVLGANNFGHAVIYQYGAVDYADGAFSGQKNTDGTLVGVPTTAAFTVNDNGAFFNQYQNGDTTKPFFVGKRNYPGGSLRAQATMLIHETAHQITVNGFQHDFGNRKAEKANNKAVDSNCRKLIEGLQ